MPVVNPHPVYFPQAVASILNQTVQELELIIVEEPSQSFGPDLLANVKDPRLRHLMHSHRTSLVQQRNRGLVEARADLVAWLDADDIAEPERMRKQLAYLHGHPDVTVLGSQLTIIDQFGKVMGRRLYPEQHEAIVRTLRRQNPIAQPAVLCRKAALLAVGGYQYDRHPATEDYELWCRLAERGCRFANHPEPLLRYRLHPQGAKAAKLRGILRGTIEIKRRYFAGTMNVAETLRLWGEHGLLWLPPAWVYAMFKRIEYEPSTSGPAAQNTAASPAGELRVER